LTSPARSGHTLVRLMRHIDLANIGPPHTGWIDAVHRLAMQEVAKC
jgi:hypothetical protein